MSLLVNFLLPAAGLLWRNWTGRHNMGDIDGEELFLSLHRVSTILVTKQYFKDLQLRAGLAALQALPVDHRECSQSKRQTLGNESVGGSATSAPGPPLPQRASDQHAVEHSQLHMIVLYHVQQLFGRAVSSVTGGRVGCHYPASASWLVGPGHRPPLFECWHRIVSAWRQQQ